jgi:hypothetical protein
MSPDRLGDLGRSRQPVFRFVLHAVTVNDPSVTLPRTQTFPPVKEIELVRRVLGRLAQRLFFIFHIFSKFLTIYLLRLARSGLQGKSLKGFP